MRCLQYRPDCDDLSVDESMIPYYGGNCSKQRIQNKPVRVGYKMWVLAESFGYVVQFDPYQGAKLGASHRSSPVSWGLGETLVLSLLDVLPAGVSFDNFFTSLRLLQHLGSNNIRASGIVNQNRLTDCPVMRKKELEKSERGFSDQRTISF